MKSALRLIEKLDVTDTNAGDLISRDAVCYLMWQYCKDPNDIQKVIDTKDGNWEGLESLHQIISITYDMNHGCYVVFWIAYRDMREVQDEHK